MLDENNIVDGHGLDEDCAKRNFLGKTADDASQMFRADNNHCFTEDFMYLSDLAVRYFLPAVIEYAESDDSTGDYLFTGGIATSLALRLEQHDFSDSTKAVSQQFARLVLSDLEKYDLDRACKDDLFWINSLEYIAGDSHGPRRRD